MKTLIDNLLAPLGDAKSAKFAINIGTGNLTIDRLTSDEQLLASGKLQYLENQGVPAQSVNRSNGQATLTLKAGDIERPWFRFPWDACVGAYEWQLHLNPNVRSDITAHSDGGNVKLDLAGMTITRLSAETGGGNMDVVLPDNATDLTMTANTGGGNVTVDMGSDTTGSNTLDASSGAGNVDVRLPSGIAALIHASSGWGKVTVDPQFSQAGSNTYQSPNYDSAANKVEITARSGAGNVSIYTR